MLLLEAGVSIPLGILLGIFTGLTPGIHINLVASFLLASTPLLLSILSPFTLALIIGAMAITHTFLDAIPSIFLGAPDSDTVLSVLPGHRLLLQGKGYEAVMLTAVGSLGGLVLSVVLTPGVILLARAAYPFLRSKMGFILLAAAIFLIGREKRWAWALVCFLLAGILGLAVFSLEQLEEPLLPLLSGLFGTSLLLMSLRSRTIIPPQETTQALDLPPGEGWKGVFGAICGGLLGAFLPGLGPSQMALLGSQGIRLSPRGFLVLVGGLNTVGMVLSFVALYVIDRPRNGAVIAIAELLPVFSGRDLLAFLGMCLLVGGLAAFLTSYLTKGFARLVQCIKYSTLCWVILGFVTGLVGLLSGGLGLGVLLVATLVGLLPTLKGIGKNHLMGCLLLPVMLYFLF